MGRKPIKAPSEYVSPEEMLQRIDKAIRDRRASPIEILKLQRKRERVMEQIALQQAAQPADPSSEFTAAQQLFLNKLTGDDYGLTKERELWEGVYRAENARWAAFYARNTGDRSTPVKTEPASTWTPPELYEPSTSFPTSQDQVAEFIKHAASLRAQGKDPTEMLRQYMNPNSSKNS
jgi:hypothetical protein